MVVICVLRAPDFNKIACCPQNLNSPITWTDFLNFMLWAGGIFYDFLIFNFNIA